MDKTDNETLKQIKVRERPINVVLENKSESDNQIGYSTHKVNNDQAGYSTHRANLNKIMRDDELNLFIYFWALLFFPIGIIVYNTIDEQKKPKSKKRLKIITIISAVFYLFAIISS